MQNGPRARETKQNRKQKRRMCCSNDLKIVTATHPFSLAGTAVKASETDAQPDAGGSVLRGLGSFPNKQKIAFVSRKPCLQKSLTVEINCIEKRTKSDKLKI